MSVGWTFKKRDCDLDIAYNNAHNVPCYIDFKDEYNEDLDMYIKMQTYTWCIDAIEQLNKHYKNIKFIKLLNKTTKQVRTNSWGEPIYEEVEDDEGGESRYLYRIEVSKEYDPTARYILTYLAANILRMFALDEGYPRSLKYEGEFILEYLVQLNKKIKQECNFNTNHILTVNINFFNFLCLEFLDNIKRVNEFFVEGSNVPIENNQEYYSYRSSVTFIKGSRLSQTMLFTVVYNHLKENL